MLIVLIVLMIEGMLWDKMLGVKWIPLSSVAYADHDTGDGKWISLDSELVLQVISLIVVIKLNQLNHYFSRRMARFAARTRRPDITC